MTDWSRYVGNIVEVIYMDRQGRMTQRTVRIQSVKDDVLAVYCLERRAPRLLRAEQILAVQRTRSG
ncbi:MAG: hypothetical protein J7639_21175 [Paenibacillaceae bacterium]|nr:hypothetical protein [Paenibacillaceae bacterium]